VQDAINTITMFAYQSKLEVCSSPYTGSKCHIYCWKETSLSIVTLDWKLESGKFTLHVCTRVVHLMYQWNTGN